MYTYNEENQIIGSFILLLLQTPRLKFALHGIGSVVVHQLYQRMGMCTVICLKTF